MPHPAHLNNQSSVSPHPGYRCADHLSIHGNTQLIPENSGEWGVSISGSLNLRMRLQVDDRSSCTLPPNGSLPAVGCPEHGGWTVMSHDMYSIRSGVI